MCEPTLIAAGVTAGLSIAQGYAQKSSFDAQEANLRLQGRQAFEAGNFEANQARVAASRHLGAVRAIQSASGVDLSSGSAADVGGHIAANDEMEALMKLYKGRIGKWQANYAATVAGSQGDAAVNSGFISAGTTLLGAGVKGGYFNSLFGSTPGAGTDPLKLGPPTS